MKLLDLSSLEIFYKTISIHPLTVLTIRCITWLTAEKSAMNHTQTDILFSRRRHVI